MKSIKRFAYLGAIALVSAGFVACNKNEPTQEGNYNGETVKTQFSISLPKQAVGKRNMAPETVQSAGTAASFRGMDNIVLIPFKVATAGNPVAATDTRFGVNIALNSFAGEASDPAATKTAAANSIAPAAAEVAGAGNAHLFQDVQIPLRTNAFLFYGKACNGAVNADADTDAKKHQYGFLNVPTVWTGEPSAYTFAPAPIYEATLATTKGQAIVAYLNSIAQTSINVDADNNPSTPEVQVLWKDYSDPGLVDLYNSFTHNAAGTGATCGSSATVRALVEDLYNALNSRVALSDPMAIAIQANITATGKATVASNVITLDASLSNYPAEETYLPDGAIGLVFNTASNEFELITNATAATEGLNITPANKLVYPANLWYFANSAIKTATESKKTEYDGTKDWAAILTAYTTDNAAVQSNTRSVAIKNPIQYAVGRLDVTMAVAAANLVDNVESNIAVPTEGYPVTAVFIGGQKVVDWKFEPTTATDFYTIYDNAIPTGVIAKNTTPSTANHTLVLQTAPEATVQIAIEMVNTGEDFVGVNNKVIAKGTKFYMVAALNPMKSDYSAQDMTGKRVFMQDYVTTATLTIGNLKNAYNVIPDLRVPELELGLSVDLQWQAGMSFTETI